MTATHNRRKIKGLPLICLAIIIFIAGLWPFNFRPKNEVTWLSGQNGIHFGRWGIAYSKESVYGPQGAIRSGRPVSIELVVRPAREPHHSLARILTLYTEGNRQFFTLAQWKSHLILRASSEGNDLRIDSPEMGAKNVFVKNIPRFLTITSNNGITKIYADGRMIKENRSLPILPGDSSASGKFVLGNAPTGKSPWTGNLMFLTAYDRELSAEDILRHFQDWTAQGTPTWETGKTPALLYLFDDRAGPIIRNHSGYRYDISIPTNFRMLQKTVLRPPWVEDYFSRSFIRDVFINILGFLPLGFFFTAWLKTDDRFPTTSYIFLVATLGACISLAIETLQIYLPTRTSSFTDVICNVLGTILGIYLFRRFFLFLNPEKRKDF